MTNKLHWLALLTLPFLLSACDAGPKSAAGFRLPDGDPSAGELAFVDLNCHSCHTVKAVELPQPMRTGPVIVILGGPVNKIETYGDLVTSIINPSYKIARGYPKDQITENGKSLMLDYNESLTVQQLIDLVAFLQPHYELAIPDYRPY